MLAECVDLTHEGASDIRNCWRSWKLFATKLENPAMSPPATAPESCVHGRSIIGSLRPALAGQRHF